MRRLRFLFLLAPILLLLGLLYERRAQRRDRARYPAPGRVLRVNERAMHILAMGERRAGQPVVLLESGHGDWSVGWRRVQARIAQFARVISYDRAGFGWSEAGALPRSPERLVSELHALLAAAGERGPYLLVGHSLGAAFARLYASTYPDEVVGMLWIDPAHDDIRKYLPFWGAAYWFILALTRLGECAAWVGLPRLLGGRLALAAFPGPNDPAEQAMLAAQSVVPKFFAAMHAETIGWNRAANWAAVKTNFADLPVTILEAQYTAGPPLGAPSRIWQQYRAGWSASHANLSRLSTRTRRIPVESGHVIQVEAPEVVIRAIREMLEEAGDLTG